MCLQDFWNLVCGKLDEKTTLYITIIDPSLTEAFSYVYPFESKAAAIACAKKECKKRLLDGDDDYCEVRLFSKSSALCSPYYEERLWAKYVLDDDKEIVDKSFDPDWIGSNGAK